MDLGKSLSMKFAWVGKYTNGRGVITEIKADHDIAKLVANKFGTRDDALTFLPYDLSAILLRSGEDP